MVNDIQIEVNVNNKKIGLVKHRNKPYEVNILKSGTEEYVREKEALWAQMKSITTDDGNPNKKVKKSKNNFKFFFYLITLIIKYIQINLK